MIRRTANASPEEMEAFQTERLRALLHHCASNVPYYSDLFRRVGFDPERVERTADVRRIPPLTKQDLAGNMDRLVARNIPARKLGYATTGGTTGEPVGFYELSDRLQQIENAYVHDAWSALGYRRCDMLAVLRGSRVAASRDDGFHWVCYPRSRRLFLSSFDLTRESAGRYCELMRRFKVRFLHVFPSSVSLLCDLVEDAGCRPPDLAGVFSSSEVLTAAVRDKVSRILGCRILDLYGSSERTLMGVECMATGRYHFYPQYGLLELVDEGGEPVSEPGRRGEILGTSFNRIATPLVRYRIGDAGIASGTGCACGRRWPSLERIEGRVEENVISSNGRLISMSLMNFHSDAFDCISRFQFVQAAPGKVEFRYIPRGAVSGENLEKMTEDIRSKLGEGFDLRMQAVTEIPPAKSGKHRLLAQSSPESDLID